MATYVTQLMLNNNKCYVLTLDYLFYFRNKGIQVSLNISLFSWMYGYYKEKSLDRAGSTVDARDTTA